MDHNRRLSRSGAIGNTSGLDGGINSNVMSGTNLGKDVGHNSKSRNALHNASGVFGTAGARSTRMMMGTRTSHLGGPGAHGPNNGSRNTLVTGSSTVVPGIGGTGAMAGSGAVGRESSGAGGSSFGLGGQANICVLDDEGNDVTPVSLSSVHANRGVHGQFKGTMSQNYEAMQSMTSAVKDSVADVLNNLESLTMGSWNNSAMGKSGGLSFSSSSRASGASSEDRENETSSTGSGDSDKDDDDFGLNPRRSSLMSTTKRQIGAAKTQERHDPNKLLHIRLVETETNTMFDMPSIAVSNDFTEEAASVKADNSKYQELLGSRANNENFTDCGSQTINNAQKNKDVQVTGPSYVNAECMVSNWTIYDTYQSLDQSIDSKDTPESVREIDLDVIVNRSLPAKSGPSQKSHTSNSASVILSRQQMNASHGYADDASEHNHSIGVGTSASSGHGSANTHILPGYEAWATGDKETAQINKLNQENLLFSLTIAERAVVCNTNEEKLLQFRDLVAVPETVHSSLTTGSATTNDNGVEPDDANEAKDLSENEEDDEVEGKDAEDLEDVSPENAQSSQIVEGAQPGPGNSNTQAPASITNKSEGNQVCGNSKLNTVEDVAEEEEDEEETEEYVMPRLLSLWNYRCELTRGRTVSYMSWNKQNEDILAVAYGESKTHSWQAPGLVLCWSLKNPEWPDRVYRSSSSVTALDFSKGAPNLLAAGFADGRICVYDVRRKGDSPVLETKDVTGKHRDPVWELKWVERERLIGDDQSKGESLVSLSTDGRVCQWTIKKGLEHNDLMILKRVTKQHETKSAQTGTNAPSGATSGPMPSNGAQSRAGAFIARQSGGLCFDFNPKDNNIYLVGTEDGHIHRCSVSYNEQYLSTQFGHTGAVYKVKWSPFLSNMFLSASSDWTVRLWGVDDDEPSFKFQSGKDAINDIAWSPTNSTIFGCVSNDGRMEIWDLNYSILDPAVIHTVLDRQLTSIIFASKSSTVVIGDDNGVVSFYSLKRDSKATQPLRKKNKPAASPGSPEWFAEQSKRLSNVLANKNLSSQ